MIELTARELTVGIAVFPAIEKIDLISLKSLRKIFLIKVACN